MALFTSMNLTEFLSIMVIRLICESKGACGHKNFFGAF